MHAITGYVVPTLLEKGVKSPMVALSALVLAFLTERILSIILEPYFKTDWALSLLFSLSTISPESDKRRRKDMYELKYQPVAKKVFYNPHGGINLSYDLGNKAINEALKLGASYADVRIGEIFDENLTVRKGASNHL